MKPFAVVFLVMIAGVTGCSPWSKSGEDWSGSWGIAGPSASDSIASSAAVPSSVEEENPSPRLKAKETMSKREPTPPLGAQTLCALGGERRALAMIRQGTGCRLSYLNRSRVEIVAEAAWGNQVCQRVRSRIVRKLRAAGYSCN